MYDLSEILLRNFSRWRCFQVGARCGFRDFVIETDDLSGGRDLDAKFFLLLRYKPAMRPAPEAHRPAREPGHALQTLRALQIHFGGVVVVEHRDVPVALHRDSPVSEKLQGNRRGVVAVDAKVDGRFRKGLPEILRPDEERCRCHQGGDCDDLAI